MSQQHKGKYFYWDKIHLYSTVVATRYNTLKRTQNDDITVSDCHLNQYIDKIAAASIDDDRNQPTCSCCPENHLHVFRLPFMYFLIDDYAAYDRWDDRRDRSEELFDILHTLKQTKIFIYSTNNDKKEIDMAEMNLADKLIKLSEKNFDGQEFLRLVLKFTIVKKYFNMLHPIL